MKTEDFQFFLHPGVVEYVQKIYQTAPDVPKKPNKRHAIASLFLKVTNTPMKMEDFHVVFQKHVSVKVREASVKVSVKG